MAWTSAQMGRASGSEHSCRDVLCEYISSETLSHHGGFGMSVTALEAVESTWSLGCQVFLLLGPGILGKILSHVFQCTEEMLIFQPKTQS